MSIQKIMVSWNLYIHILARSDLSQSLVIHSSRLGYSFSSVPWQRSLLKNVFSLGLVHPWRHHSGKIFFIDIDIFWWYPWRFKAGHFFYIDVNNMFRYNPQSLKGGSLSILMSEQFGKMEDDSKTCESIHECSFLLTLLMLVWNPLLIRSHLSWA